MARQKNKPPHTVHLRECDKRYGLFLYRGQWLISISANIFQAFIESHFRMGGCWTFLTEFVVLGALKMTINEWSRL